jgi:hypothetical protein
MSTFKRACPACFTPEQWQAWRQVDLRCQGQTVEHTHHCHDCLPEYQSAMITVGRCEHPECTFVKIDDGWVGQIKGKHDK